jgi:hypothetical protein
MLQENMPRECVFQEIVFSSPPPPPLSHEGLLPLNPSARLGRAGAKEERGRRGGKERHVRSLRIIGATRDHHPHKRTHSVREDILGERVSKRNHYTDKRIHSIENTF